MAEQLNLNQQTLYHVGFVVSDLDVSIPFYTQKLGFTLKNRCKETQQQTDPGMGVPGCSLELAHLEGYGIVLELFEYTTARGETTPPAPNQVGCAHLSIGVGDMNAFIKKIKQEGVPLVSEPMRLTVGQWVFIKDPDGILIEVMGKL